MNKSTKPLNVAIDPELAAFMKRAEEQARLECAFWDHQWRTLPFSTGPVVVCVRCGTVAQEENDDDH